MTEVDKDFDLLAGHDLGESRVITYKDEEDPDKMNVLVWHKLETVGFQPSAREGHTAVTNGLSVLVFGGFEAGQRVNALISLDVTSCSWSVVPSKGDTPPARCYHAASRYQNLMLVHGGEGKAAFQNPHNCVSFDSNERGIDVNQSIAEDSNPSAAAGIASQSTSVLLDQHDNSRELGRRPESGRGATPKETIGHDGVTLGDTLCGTKLANQVKISRAGQPDPPGMSSSSSGIALNQAPINKTLATSSSASVLPTPTPPQICCLDDLHVLDTISMEWYKMKCILSPLPRKGHTMNIVPLQGIESAVIFGGYSIENVTLSNSLHVCEADSIYEHYIARRDLRHKLNQAQQNQSNSNHVGVIKALKQDAVEPLMWRTLSTSGTPPAPRFRHSSTLIHVDRTTPLLVIMGGIGKDATVPLNDIHLLDLNTLTWTSPLTGCNALSQGLGGDGPESGLYGHVAFSVAAMSDTVSEKLSLASGKSASENELLVFGGSSNPNSGQTNINQNIYAYSMQTHTWRIVPTGFAFPSARSNHTATLVQGWAPVHEQPGATVNNNDGLSSSVSRQTQARKSKTGSSTLRSTAAGTATGVGGSSGVCAVIFGGLDSIQCASDTWALDLQWRKSGVEQYDVSVSRQETQALHQPHVTTSAMEMSYLNTPGLTAKEANSSLKNLLDFQNYSATNLRASGQFTFNSAGIATSTSTGPAPSPLQQFRHVPLDMGFDTSQGLAHPASDRNKKQSLNSRKYADIAQSLPAFSTKDIKPETSKSKNKTSQRHNMGRSASQGDIFETEYATAVSDSPTSSRQERDRSQSFNQTTSGKNNNTTGEFTNYAINTRDYKLPGSSEEQLEIGTAFLKVRKERAQTELALNRERDKLLIAENAIVDQAAEILSLQQTIEALQSKYVTDTDALKEQLRLSEERERSLKELNEESYNLMTMYGVKKV